jgi:hypothetical protein
MTTENLESTVAPPTEVSAVVEAPVETPALTPHTDTPSLLESVAKVEETKPADPAETPEPAETETPKDPVETPELKEEPKPDEVKPDEPKPEPEPEPELKYEFQIPEEIKLEPKGLETYTEVLREAKVPPEVGQKLLNMYLDEVQKLNTSTLQAQHDAFNETRKSWQAQAMADPEIGGAGHQTAMAAIARMRDRFVPEAQKAEFNDFLRVTGAGDHPAFLKVLYNVARLLDEPRVPQQSGNPPPQPKQPGQRREVLYDHPTSQKTGR